VGVQGAWRLVSMEARDGPLRTWHRGHHHVRLALWQFIGSSPGQASLGSDTKRGLELFVHGRLARSIAVVAAVTLTAAAFLLVGGRRVDAQVVVHTQAGEVSAPVKGAAVLELPFAAEHAAVHWAGNPGATVSVAFSRDGSNFGPAFDVSRDEVGEQRGN